MTLSISLGSILPNLQIVVHKVLVSPANTLAGFCFRHHYGRVIARPPALSEGEGKTVAISKMNDKEIASLRSQ
jgi:hypothetical protein